MLLEPILMLPAYRYGRETPWGGEKLRHYGKYAPATKVGESYEFSAIPGLESCAPDGRSLSALIQQYGEALLGEQSYLTAPLVIRLVDAEDRQSVHVHLSENCANTGWYVIKAEKANRVTLGTAESFDATKLLSAIENSEVADDFFCDIPVQAGDTFVIPYGVPHSVGSGILLYEIQAAHCETYRLYDWNRVDHRGYKRAVQAEKAIRAMRNTAVHSSCTNEEQKYENPSCEQLLSTDDYCLLKLTNCENTPFRAASTYAVLTCLDQALITLRSGKTMYLSAGQTVLIPAQVCDFTLTGKEFLLAKPQI